MKFVAPDHLRATEQAQKYLVSLTSGGEISNVAYLAISLPGGAIAPMAVATYPQEWAQHYLERRYYNIDPAIIHGMSGVLPFDWATRPRETRRVRRFFGEAREFGIHEQGLSFPIRGAFGEKALFSINSTMQRVDWLRYINDNMADLCMLGYLFHLRILELIGVHQFAAPALAPREIEVLRWAADGKTSWETSEILNLSESTVTFYLRSAASKLGAATKTQAVALAIKANLLI